MKPRQDRIDPISRKDLLPAAVRIEMERDVSTLALLLLIEMVFGAIDRALAPYEAAFFAWGGWITIGVLVISALAQRFRRCRQDTGRGRSGSGLSGDARFPR